MCIHIYLSFFLSIYIIYIYLILILTSKPLCLHCIILLIKLPAGWAQELLFESWHRPVASATLGTNHGCHRKRSCTTWKVIYPCLSMLIIVYPCLSNYSKGFNHPSVGFLSVHSISKSCSIPHGQSLWSTKSTICVVGWLDSFRLQSDTEKDWTA